MKYEITSLDDPQLEMLTFDAIKSQKMFNVFAKSPNNKINLIGTFVPVSSHFSKPNFHQKPKKQYNTITYTSSVAKLNEEALNQKNQG